MYTTVSGTKSRN